MCASLFLLARYAAILQNCPSVAMLSLFNIPSHDAPKMTHRQSHIPVDSDSHHHLLPIRPKPLLYPKDSTILTSSRHSSKIAEQIGFHPILVRSICFYLSIGYVFLGETFSPHDVQSETKQTHLFDHCLQRISMMDSLVSPREISLEERCPTKSTT